jgi:hypothetical protein
MLSEARALAICQGDDPANVKLNEWRIHDIRRTMRTGLSSLPVSDMVRELVIAHTRPALHKVYDQFAYLDEKRQALDLWATRLRSIITPPLDNVVASRCEADMSANSPKFSDRVLALLKDANFMLNAYLSGYYKTKNPVYFWHAIKLCLQIIIFRFPISSVITLAPSQTRC